MSTRAVYTFNKCDFHPEVHIYIHHDGYPDGAAYHLYNMASIGIGPEALLRSNDKAEITSSWKDHGDLDYRYEIDGRRFQSIVRVYKKYYGDASEHIWSMKRETQLVDFINGLDGSKEWVPDGFSPFRPVEMGWGEPIYLNVHTAKTFMESKSGPLSHLRAWKGRYEGSANWRSCIKDIRALTKEFPSIATEETNVFLAMPPLSSLNNK